MGQSTGEQATEPSCRTQKTHEALRSGQLTEHSGSTATECPPEPPRLVERSVVGADKSLSSRQNTSPTRPRPRPCLQSSSTHKYLSNKSMKFLKKASTKTRGEGRTQKPKPPETCGCERPGPPRGQRCSPEFLNLSADPGPSHTVSAPTASKDVPPALNILGETSPRELFLGSFFHFPNTS